MLFFLLPPASSSSNQKQKQKNSDLSPAPEYNDVERKEVKGQGEWSGVEWSGQRRTRKKGRRQED